MKVQVAKIWEAVEIILTKSRNGNTCKSFNLLCRKNSNFRTIARIILIKIILKFKV